MEIKTAKFIKGIKGTDEILNDGKIKIAFIGRSNVGKSSLINSLTNKKDLVKSSSLPGKTREINFFLINDDPKNSGSGESFYFVDLPGYGFAKIENKQREKLRKLILWYLFSKETLNNKIVLVIDFKVGLSKFDLEMLYLLRENNLNYIIVANKVDKISKGSRLSQLKKIESETGEKNIILYSSKTNEGREDLLLKIFS